MCNICLLDCAGVAKSLSIARRRDRSFQNDSCYRARFSVQVGAGNSRESNGSHRDDPAVVDLCWRTLKSYNG